MADQNKPTQREQTPNPAREEGIGTQEERQGQQRQNVEQPTRTDQNENDQNRESNPDRSNTSGR